MMVTMDSAVETQMAPKQGKYLLRQKTRIVAMNDRLGKFSQRDLQGVRASER